MTFFNWLNMFGGLAFFLYGMSVMGEGLEKQSGGSLTTLLGKMTSNPIKGVALGAIVTAVIQSSSATTVMVVGFVNAGLMDLTQSMMQLRQALSIIMGANIGTTITAWFLSMVGIESDNFFINMLKPSSFSPIIAMVGICLLMFSKSTRKKDVGSIFLGFALLMYGMLLMSDSAAPLADMPEFANLLVLFQNPLLGMLMGMLMTAVLQSSSASVGILQAITISGLVTYSAAVPIILGQNIGTCVTAMLSSIGTSKNAKRAALGHLYFNIIGAFIFMLAFYGLNQIIHFSFFNEPVTAFNVAILHSLFNVTCTLVLLPFTKHLERLVCFSIKDKEEKKNAALPNLLDERLLVTPGVAIDAADKVTLEMGILGRENLDLAFEVLQKYDSKKSDLMEENENRVDGYEDKLGSYLIRLSERSLSQQDNRQISKLLHTITDFERISDHTCNLLNSATELHEKKISFSEPAMQDLLVLRQAISEILDLTLNCFASEDLADAIQVEPLEEVIDEICINVKNRHIDRMQRGLCSLEKGFIFQDVLTNLERMSDHCSNIAACIIELQHNSFDTHKYLNELRSSGNQSYKNLQKYYREAYKLPELPKL